MPELPEVETVRKDLSAAITGRRFVEVSATGARTIRRTGDRQAFEARLRGVRVSAVERHGKFLLLRTKGAGGVGRSSRRREPGHPGTVVVHLRMSGQLLLARPDDPEPKHLHVRILMDDGWEVRFVDPRTFGEWFISESPVSGGTRPIELAHLGPDAHTELPTVRALAASLARKRTAVKIALVDQRVIAGIGNIYSDEILHRARIRPNRSADTLRLAEATRLHDAIATVLGRAIELRGSTLGDAQYVDVSGTAGGFQAEHAVYGRAGEPCRTCATAILRVPIGARSAFTCRKCQR